MNFEDLYQNIIVSEKAIKDKLASMQKSFKSLTKNSENGDLKSYTKDLSQLQNYISEQQELLASLQNQIDSFNTRQYIESGDFVQQLLEQCENTGVDAHGVFPVYEIFPYKVRIDIENLDLYVDRKKVQCFRPLSFVNNIKKSQEKLLKTPFNASSFLNELAVAYDIAIAIKSKTHQSTTPDSDLSLKDLYLYLAPMQRYRRDYDMQNYAYDLSRLYSSDIELTKDGRKFQIGTSRTAKKFIRILDADGKDQLLATIRFYN